ncbi:hypothetical protein I550_2778 [Mycobacterium intracellulare 1956]|uniref:Uncharacterized protein n=1 Tax=Mycobacterium intracellulare 1956 TaxID=1299331 RepID=X8CWL5_MYCIT|nr:hypothetical protein I550_2778 [Mycobacterium intracellulare 1956]
MGWLVPLDPGAAIVCKIFDVSVAVELLVALVTAAVWLAVPDSLVIFGGSLKGVCLVAEDDWPA